MKKNSMHNIWSYHPALLIGLCSESISAATFKVKSFHYSYCFTVQGKMSISQYTKGRIVSVTDSVWCLTRRWWKSWEIWLWSWYFVNSVFVMLCKSSAPVHFLRTEGYAVDKVKTESRGNLLICVAIWAGCAGCGFVKTLGVVRSISLSNTFSSISLWAVGCWLKKNER